MHFNLLNAYFCNVAIGVYINSITNLLRIIIIFVRLCPTCGANLRSTYIRRHQLYHCPGAQNEKTGDTFSDDDTVYLDNGT